MNVRATQNRRTLRARANPTRFNASLKRGRAMATHMVAAGFDDDTVKGMSTALKGLARRTGMQPVKVARTRNTVNGKGGRKARLVKVNHYTAAQVQELLTSYKPRKAAYVAAKNVLIAA